MNIYIFVVLTVKDEMIQSIVAGHPDKMASGYDDDDDPSRYDRQKIDAFACIARERKIGGASQIWR